MKLKKLSTITKSRLVPTKYQSAYFDIVDFDYIDLIARKEKFYEFFLT